MPTLPQGSTDVTRYIRLRDADNEPVINVVPSTLTLAYLRHREALSTPTSAAALGSASASHADNRAIEIDDTYAPGLYRVDWPDAAFAPTAKSVTLVVTAPGAVPWMEIIDLEVDPSVDDQILEGVDALTTQLTGFQTDTSSSLDDALANLGTLQTDLTTFSAATGDSLAELDAKIETVSGQIGSLGTLNGVGTVAVTPDYGGTGELMFLDPANDAPIDNANVAAYLRADWDAGRRTNDFVRARALTQADGSWTNPLMLDPGDYTLLFFRQGDSFSRSFGPTTANIEVT